MKEIKITPPEGYEIDKANSTFDCIRFIRIEKEYPIEVKDIPNRHWYINENGVIKECHQLYQATNQVSTEERAEAFLALKQLVELRDAWNEIDGFKVDWNNSRQAKFCIEQYCDKITTEIYYNTYKVLHFGSSKTHDLFFKTFKDLIKQAKELL